MATITASPPGVSPPASAALSRSPPLAPLITSQPQRKTSQNRLSSLLARRISAYSSSRSVPPVSRPDSTIFPAFPSNLGYTLVRDFAYPWNHPVHYGHQEESAPTPASESRRVSDPALANWEDSRSQWSATPSWITDSANQWTPRDQLPARAFNDGGPPYSEDEDLQSPVVRTSRHRKHKSERGRSPGAAGPHRGIIIGARGDQIEEYHPTEHSNLDGPGGEIEVHTAAEYRASRHRDSNFAKPVHRSQSPYEGSHGRTSGDDLSDDDARYSKDYSFSIASPDEEMHGKAVALFDFTSEHENELPLREGQIILVSYRHGQGWLVAEDPVSGESGLVPEEFVRLVRHIEGGLHGLNSLEEGDLRSPVTNDTGSAITPTAPLDAFDKERMQPAPAVQSKFSTHTRDFSPMPRASRDEGARSLQSG